MKIGFFAGGFLILDGIFLVFFGDIQQQIKGLFFAMLGFQVLNTIEYD